MNSKSNVCKLKPAHLLPLVYSQTTSNYTHSHTQTLVGSVLILLKSSFFFHRLKSKAYIFIGSILK